MRGTIPGVCPHCRAKIDLAQAAEDAVINRALAALAGFAPAPLRRVLIPYLSLFSPPGRAIAPAKLARIAEDLAALIQSGEVTRNRETAAAHLDDWVAGIDIVLQSDTLDLPLDVRSRKDPHAYLKSVVHTNATKRTRRSEAADKPLHPSHRPAAPEALGRDSGPAHAAALLSSLRPRQTPEE